MMHSDSQSLDVQNSRNGFSISNEQQQSDSLTLLPGSFYKADTAENTMNRLQTGPCYGTKSQVFGFPDTMCAPDGCIWSPKIQQNVAISLYPFRIVAKSKRSRCPSPRGGQFWLPGYESDITISFIIAMKNDVANALACIIQVFKVSREVDSAEVIVVDDGSTDNLTALYDMIHDLRSLFKFKISMLRNAESLGIISILFFLFSCCFFCFEPIELGKGLYI
jgi:hypothetical protein